jgi:hypothetical protein
MKRFSVIVVVGLGLMFGSSCGDSSSSPDAGTADTGSSNPSDASVTPGLDAGSSSCPSANDTVFIGRCDYTAGSFCIEFYSSTADSTFISSVQAGCPASVGTYSRDQPCDTTGVLCKCTDTSAPTTSTSGKAITYQRASASCGTSYCTGTCKVKQ